MGPLWLVAGAVVVGALMSSRSSSSSSSSPSPSQWASLPIPVRVFIALVERRRAQGLSVPGSRFGQRPNPRTGAPSFHAGQDLPCAVGTPLLAVADGVVSSVQLGTKAGNLVRYQIDSPPGRVSCMHLQTIDVRAGDVVRAGQVIGTTGATGEVTGPHLHIEWKPDGASSSADPLPLFPIPEGVA